MSPKRSSIAVAALLSSSGIIAAPIAFVCENYPDWAAPALMGFFLLLFLTVVGSLIAFRRRRRAQFGEFGVGMGQRGAAICRACSISGLGTFLGLFEGTFFRALGVAFATTGICICAWQMFRAWPEGDGGEVRGIPPTA